MIQAMTLPPETAGPSAGPRVLVVDDDARNTEVIAGFLSLEGLQVSTAEDGETALAAVAGAPPDLILLDVMMPPGLDGFEVCRRLKADPATVFIPVVLLTALRGTSERVRGAAAGADDFLSKPFDHVELITRVKSLLRVKRLHDELQDYNRALEARVAERTLELQQALRQLREVDRLKSEFIANVSHELRTPLLHVKGYIGLIAEGALGPFNAEQERGIRVAQQAVNQLERIVRDVVDFRDLHDRQLDRERVLAGDVCRNALEALSEVAGHKELRLSLEIAPELPPVLADRVALVRVLRHLLDNAIKFSPPQSRVLVRAERRDTRVRFSVFDQGPGIPLERQDEIFDIFYQSDGSSTRRTGGMGLGLAVVKVLLEAQQSQIQLDSTPGRGSIFYFELPVVER